MFNMKPVQEQREYDLAQYYRGTWVITPGSMLNVQLVRDVEDDCFIFMDERLEASSCGVILPETGYYNGTFISTDSSKDYKKGMRLTDSQARALKRYLNTGNGFSKFAICEDLIMYLGTECGAFKGGYHVIPDPRLARMYREEYKVEVFTSIQNIKEAA